MPAPEWDDLAGRLRHGTAVVALAAQVDAGGPSSSVGPEGDSWAEVFDQADTLLRARAARRVAVCTTTTASASACSPADRRCPVAVRRKAKMAVDRCVSTWRRDDHPGGGLDHHHL
ncbi:MAG: hypothetical protein ACRD0Q_08725 [Acidimicrobiales bacterium]